MTKWTPPLSIAELARTASHLACGAKHIEATWSEIDAEQGQAAPERRGVPGRAVGHSRETTRVAHQTNAVGQVVAQTDRKFADVPVAAGRKRVQAPCSVGRGRRMMLMRSLTTLITPATASPSPVCCARGSLYPGDQRGVTRS